MPRHIRNIAIALLLALLALIAGIKGYTHHQIKTNVDSALSSIRALATIKYGDISTYLLSGKVEFENVRVSAAFLPESLNIGNITIETPGFSYLLNAADNIKNSAFPEQLGFVIDDFYFDLHGETADWLDRVVDRIQPVYSKTRKLCAGKSIFSPSDYKKMGYTRLLSTMRLAYDFNKDDESLNIQLSAGISNMSDINIDINITNIASMDASEAIQSGLPQLSKVEINYKDQGYAERTINFCTALSNMEKDAFIDAETQQPDKYFYALWGFAPGKGLRGAYKDFLLKPDLVTLTMSPSNNFNPLTLTAMSTDEITMSSVEIMAALNVRLKINDLNIDNLNFKVPSPAFNKQLERKRAKALDINSLLRGDPIKAPIKEAKRYRKAPPEYHKIRIRQIPRHIGDFILITTKNGNERKGQLIKLTKKNLYVEKRVSGGKFTMTVPRAKIKSVKAYFSK